MKVLLVIPSSKDLSEGAYYSGVDYHRLYIPHKALYNQWEDIEFITTNDITSVTQEVLKISRVTTKSIFQFLKKVPTIQRFLK